MNNSLIADPHQRKLLKKWGAILESGKKIQSESTKIALAQVLENTRNYYKMKGMLNEAGVAQDVVMGKYTPGDGVLNGPNNVPYAKDTSIPANYGDYYLPNVVMPMLRRIMPDLIANDLVGVQPLNGPVGYALAYRPLAGTREIGYEPVDTQYTGLTAEGASGTLTSELGYTGALTGGSDMSYWNAYAGESANKWEGTGKKIGFNSEFENLYGFGGADIYPTVSFGLVKSAVEAKTRKLAAHWSPELAEDMQAMHGVDVEREMVNTLTYEVGAEIDRQIITEMVKAAITGGSVSEWNPISADGLDQMGRLATLLTQITVEAQQIAIRTRRGAANFVVTTPRVCALLQQMSMNKFTSFKSTDAIPTVPDSGVGALAKVGLINDDQQLLVRDSYAAVGSADYVLMGYKGKQAGDSGIIYCPYIPLQLAKVMQPGSFTPSVGARTRYGIMSNPWDARNFYHFMKITNVDTPYSWNGERHFIATPSPIKVTNVSPVFPQA